MMCGTTVCSLPGRPDSEHPAPSAALSPLLRPLCGDESLSALDQGSRDNPLHEEAQLALRQEPCRSLGVFVVPWLCERPVLAGPQCSCSLHASCPGGVASCRELPPLLPTALYVLAHAQGPYLTGCELLLFAASAWTQLLAPAVAVCCVCADSGPYSICCHLPHSDHPFAVFTGLWRPLWAAPAPSTWHRPSPSLLRPHSRSFQAHLRLCLCGPNSWEPGGSWWFSARVGRGGGLLTVLTGDGSMSRGLGRGVLPSCRPSRVRVPCVPVMGVLSMCVWLSGTLICSFLVTRGVERFCTDT